MSPVKFPLRLNMQRDAVGDLHAALEALDIEVDAADVAARRFGKSTRDAVTAFQKQAGLTVTGEIDAKTARAVNGRVAERTGTADGPTHRVRGTLRDERGRPIGRRSVRVFRKTLKGEELVAEKTTYDNGFYDISFPAPAKSFDLIVKTFDDDVLVDSSPVFVEPGRTMWVNFNAGEQAYRGPSRYAVLDKATRQHLEGIRIAEPARAVGRRTDPSTATSRVPS